MKTKITLLFLVMFMVFIPTHAQEGTITGVVTSLEDGMPLPGVNVLVKGTSRGTITDFDGNYSISAGSGEILEFSFIGMLTKEVPVGTQNTINVALEVSSATLDEVVLIGYGSQKKSDLTGVITTLKSEEIAKTPTGQAMQALQGKVAGLQVVSSGSPGTAPRCVFVE